MDYINIKIPKHLSASIQNRPTEIFNPDSFPVSRPYFVCRFLKGTVSRDFLLLVFFISFPPAPEYPIRTVSNFFENSRRYSQLKVDTGVADTGSKWEKSSIRKILIILLGHLWIVELTYIYIFAFKFTLRYLQPNINPIVCHRCHWHRWKICRRCRWDRWQFATSVVDTDGKYWWQICHRYQQH